MGRQRGENANVHARARVPAHGARYLLTTSGDASPPHLDVQVSLYIMSTGAHRSDNSCNIYQLSSERWATRKGAIHSPRASPCICWQCPLLANHHTQVSPPHLDVKGSLQLSCWGSIDLMIADKTVSSRICVHGVPSPSKREPQYRALTNGIRAPVAVAAGTVCRWLVFAPETV